MCVRAWCAHVRISLSNRRAKRKKRFKCCILVSLIDMNVVTGARGDVSKKRLLGHAEKHKAESQLAHPRKYRALAGRQHARLISAIVYGHSPGGSMHGSFPPLFYGHSPGGSMHGSFPPLLLPPPSDQRSASPAAWPISP